MAEPSAEAPSETDEHDSSSADDDKSKARAKSRLELVAVILLAVTAVLTAWSGFESSKWGGAMSIAFSRASSARIEASRFDAQANTARGIDLDSFALWLQAYADDDQELLDFTQTRFTDHFSVAFEAWLDERPLQNPDAPKTPFQMEEYQPPGVAEAADADARADAMFARALANNQRGDNYTILTVLFAMVLFFAAISQRIESPRLARYTVAGAGVLMLVGVGFLIAFPKII